MLILAGVSINAIVGDNGVLTRTQYASFLNEMAAVEEAVQLWKAGESIEANGEETKLIPANGLCKANELTATERLVGEVGYYRVWSLSETQPTTDILSSASDFNSAFESEIVAYPAGVQDLYYLNNEALEIKGNKTYLIDASTGMIYSMTGIGLKGVRCYSSSMAKAVMNGDNTAPLFAEAEVSGTGSDEKLAGNTEPEFLEDGSENPNYNPYGFRIITSRDSANIYKLYNNGDLYGKGVKSIALGNTKTELENLSIRNWAKIQIPQTGGEYKKIFVGRNTIYVINQSDELFAYGSNDNNKLGLSVEQQKEFTGRELMKLSIKKEDGQDEKIKNVFEVGDCVYVLTINNEMYSAGYNGTTYGSCGVGSLEATINTFTKCKGLPSNQEVVGFDGQGQYNGTSNVVFLYENGDIYRVGYIQSGELSSSFVKMVSAEDINDKFSSKILKITVKGATIYGVLENGKVITIDSRTNIKELSSFSNIKDCFSGYGSAPVFFQDSNYDVYLYGSLSSTETQTCLGLDKSIYTDDSGKVKSYIKLNDYLPSDMTNNDYIKEVKIVGNGATGFGVLYIMNSGRVWGSGQIATIGVSEDYYNSMLSSSLELTCIIGNGSVRGISNINDIKIHSFSNSKIIYSDQKIHIVLLVDENNNIYTTGNENIMFGDDILEKSWKKIATNVKDVFTNGTGNIAYIDKENNGYVAMTNFKDFGEESLEPVNVNSDLYFRKITDTNLAGKISKIVFGSGCVCVLTNDQNLYVASRGKYDTSWVKNAYNGLGGQALTRQTLLATNTTQISDNVYSWIHVSNNKTYFTGALYYQGTNITQKYNDISTEFNISGLDPSKIVKITNVWEEGVIILDDGSIFLGGRRSVIGNMPGTKEFSHFTPDDLGLDGKVVDCVHSVKSYDSIILLTDKGSVYGVGPENLLGLNSVSNNVQKTFKKLTVGDDSVKVNSIHGLSNSFVAVKEDGTVWGTGFNEYGILGRWSGIGRGDSNSRYKTALNWVECPELEI